MSHSLAYMTNFVYLLSAWQTETMAEQAAATFLNPNLKRFSGIAICIEATAALSVLYFSICANLLRRTALKYFPS